MKNLSSAASVWREYHRASPSGSLVGPPARSRGVSHDIYAKALAIRYGDGPPAVLLTADLVGYSEALVNDVNHAADRMGVTRDRFIMLASHNHSAPVTSGVLSLYYD